MGGYLTEGAREGKGVPCELGGESVSLVLPVPRYRHGYYAREERGEQDKEAYEEEYQGVYPVSILQVPPGPYSAVPPRPYGPVRENGHRSRSEERRAGKECRSRWSP